MYENHLITMKFSETVSQKCLFLSTDYARMQDAYLSYTEVVQMK